jgi:poly(3-hydroxybutyrate) depolymerase
MSFLVAVAASLSILLPGNSAALQKSSGCDSPTPFSAGSSVSRTIQPATARDGRYTIYLPSAYDQGEPMPLVIGLHGWTSSGAAALRGSAFSKTAETYGLVTAWPDGVNYPQAGRGWAFPGCNASPPVGEVDAFGRRAVCEVGDTYNCDSSSWMPVRSRASISRPARPPARNAIRLMPPAR